MRDRMDGFERASSGLYVPRDVRRSMGRHLYEEVGCISDTRELQEIARRLDMKGNDGYVACVAWQNVVGTAFSSFTAAKSIINPQALWNTMPPNLWRLGRKMRARIWGALSNIVTTPGLFNIQIKIGTVAAYDTGNIQWNATAHTLLPFWLDIDLVLATEGSGTAATLRGLGQITSHTITRTAAQVDSVQDDPTILVPQVTPVPGTGFDSSIPNVVDVWGGMTISNAANTLRIDGYALELVN